MNEVIVIGAGVGGLAAAIDLAAKGHSVRVLEAATEPGGKAGVHWVEGVEVDTGPSVLTLPRVFEDLFAAAGARLSEHVELTRPTPAFRYVYPDGVRLEVHHDLEETLASVERTLGPSAATELAAFMRYASRIWQAGAPDFVFDRAPTWTRMVRLGLVKPQAVWRIDGLRTMQRAIEAQVRSTHLRQLLLRYATYNGSSPRLAPATLNCIAHVELALGGYGVSGGIYRLVLAMVRLATRLGVELEYGRRVRGVVTEGARVTGVRTDSGRVFAADAVVCNADAAFVRDVLLEGAPCGRIRAEPPSMSGWTGIVRAKRVADRAPHTVLFPRVYAEEFFDIFERDRPPVEPAVYLAAQERCHRRKGWAEEEPVFVMANTPAEPSAGTRPDETWQTIRETVLERIRSAGLIAAEDRLVWERTPRELALRFPGSRGSLYGAASHGALAAFRRPANRLPGVRGLYLASGSAHPGGGLPLVALSGRAAASCVDEDLAGEGAPAIAAAGVA